MSDQVALFGIRLDRLTLASAVDRLTGWIAERERPCRYVVTPNVDHTVLLKSHAGLRDAYEEAGMVLADGLPVVLASRLLGRSLPERVAGSDLVPALFAAAQQAKGLRVFLLGAMPGVGQRAAARIRGQWPQVDVVGVHSPPLGFEQDEHECQAILECIRAARPDVVIVGFGAPKQELWVHRHRDQIEASAAICAGATIDFLAGEKRRAPRWMQRVGLEWLHRCLSEPRRLAGRYLRDAVIFPTLVWKEWRLLDRSS